MSQTAVWPISLPSGYNAVMDIYRPSFLAEADVAACIGLISDTHMPLRWPSLPTAVSTALVGVDMVVHAGDVGELWVLDELSRIAPVTAVHGNDEPRAATSTLPEKVLLSVAGQRLLLWHGHYTHRVDEVDARRYDAVGPKLERLAAHAQAGGATTLLFGHWHIPLTATVDGVTLINGGAIASGSFTTRQTRQSVARVYLTRDGRALASHIDLAQPQRPFTPQFNAADGFAANWNRVAASMTDDLVAANLSYLQRELAPLLDAGLQRPLLSVLHRCWRGEQTLLTLESVTAAALADPDLPAATRKAYLQIVDALPHKRP